MKPIILSLLSCIFPFTLFAQNIAGNYSLSFMENKGQVADQDGNQRPDIQYRLGATTGLSVFIGNGAIHYQFSTPQNLSQKIGANAGISTQIIKHKLHTNYECLEYDMYRLDVTLGGANPSAQVVADEQQEYCERYYTPGVCAENATAHSFKRITYKDIYPDIDWVLYIKDGQLEYDFIVKPGGNANDIKILYGGATDLQVTPGNITAVTPMGDIQEGKLYCYEQKNGKAIAANYVLADGKVRVETGSHKGTLVIDPRLQWATYYGGCMNFYESTTQGLGIIADTLGNIYATGLTRSIANIATSGGYLTTYHGEDDAFLAKFRSDGSIEWATYYGGNGGNESYCLSKDDSSNIYIGGFTSSTTDIATSGSYQSSYGGGGDAFIAKFTASGSLLWATYYGGSGSDRISGITCDSVGNVYITGFTFSVDSIATHGAYKTTYSADGDAFLAKFSPAGSLLWGTYYGGSGTDAGSISCSDGNVYITGSTSSTGGIATPGTYQVAYGGGSFDAFIAKFNDSGALIWGTYFGGNLLDIANAISTDRTGDVYISGLTYSTNGIATPGAYKANLSSGGEDNAFLAKFTDSGAIEWATYYGGLSTESDCITTDNTGNVYMGGTTTSTDSIATAGAYQTYYNGYTNGNEIAFITKFSSGGTLLWGSYFGGDSANSGNGIACDNAGNFYLIGETTSSEGVATANAYDTAYYGARAAVAFIAKFDSLTASGVPQINAAIEGVNIYPNPTNDALHVTWQGILQPIVQLSVLNMVGQQVYAASVPSAANRAVIPVSGLAAGVYVCVLQGGEGRYYGKFSVVR